jgi:signal transduction histidine kinase
MLEDSKKGEAKEVLDEIKTLMDQVENGSRKANDIIRNLKSYVPSENNGISKYLSPLDISMEIETLINSQKRRHPDVAFHSKIEPNLEILANKFDLDQAISNILNNAVESIPENRSGRITISLEKKDNTLLLSIIDNGKGIKPEHLKEVMEPFFTTKEQGQGTGLGLFSAYNIIKKNSGDITIESELGSGTSVKVFLPFE